MSKHAEFEASIRDLPPILLAQLKQSKIEKLRNIKLNEKNKGQPSYKEEKWDTNKFFLEKKGDELKGFGQGVLSAVCMLDKSADSDCEEFSADAFNNLCLAESITNGKEPRVVCDEQWIADIGADSTEIAKFETGYDLWKSIFLTSVKWLMKNQSAIKLKQHVTVSLGYRQDNFAGEFVDKVCFEENAWKKAFGKLQASTKISEQTFWVLAYFFHVDRDLTKIPIKAGDVDGDGVKTIIKFVVRSLEVRTDNALSFLKFLETNTDLILFNIDQIEFNVKKDVDSLLFASSVLYGVPTLISHLIEKKPNLKFDKDLFQMGFFTAMQDDNQALFDFLLKIQILSNGKDVDKFLKSVAMNSVKFKNNEAYFYKLLAASGQSFKEFITEITPMEEYSDVIKSMERRLILRNPFLNELSVGDKAERSDFLKKVKRSNSKNAGA